MKDSADGILIFKVSWLDIVFNYFYLSNICRVQNDRNDELRLMPVEVKSRVSVNTAEEAIKQLRQCVGAEDWDESRRQMFSFDSSNSRLLDLLGSELFPKRRSQEMFQLLHHAFVYSVDEVLMLVGNDSHFLFAIRIKFLQDLLIAYAKLVDVFYEKWFKIFYVGNCSDLPVEMIEKALDIRNQSKKECNFVDLHSFWTNYKLWRCLNINVYNSFCKCEL